ncbi:hypothetical protein EMCRGX_G006686 [Ephydatia muelleri]
MHAKRMRAAHSARSEQLDMQQVISDISTDKFASNIAVGGPGGDVFCFLGRTEHNVRNITFFRTDGVIRCLTCFNFHSDEQVRTVYLYSNSMNGGRFAGIKVVTDSIDNRIKGLETDKFESFADKIVGTYQKLVPDPAIPKVKGFRQKKALWSNSFGGYLSFLCCGKNTFKAVL